MRSKHVVKLLTVSDLHQSMVLFQQLSDAVALHQPDAVACVGDVLDALRFSAKTQFTTGECAAQLANLPVKHLLFIRGNHEDANWTEFVAAWPHDRRPIYALHGREFTVGPLVIVGFPCHTGIEFGWCAHLEAGKTEMKLTPSAPSEELPVEFERWLPNLMRQLGPAGRTVWLMHEPPIASPLGSVRTCNARWLAAIERFSPRVVICGHDHDSPLRNGSWSHRLGTTLCVNVGQLQDKLRYTVVEFEFSSAVLSLPVAIRVRAFPQGGAITV